jgi:hypothetical protein
LRLLLRKTSDTVEKFIGDAVMAVEHLGKNGPLGNPDAPDSRSEAFGGLISDQGGVE